jgi:hypothetical protein
LDEDGIKAAWLKIFGRVPSSRSLQKSAHLKNLWAKPTPRVDEILAEVQAAHKHGQAWNSKTQRWEKRPKVVWLRPRRTRKHVMLIDSILEVFDGARIVGADITPQELAMIDANTAKGYRNKDGVWCKAESDDDRERCERASISRGKRCGGPIIDAIWPDRVARQCHRCGRAVKLVR